MDHDADGYFRTNAELHRAIALGAVNQRLEQVLLVLENQMRIALHRVAGSVRHMQAGYDEHVAVVDAIAAGKAETAEQEMRRHIANTIDRSRRALTGDTLPL